MMNTLSASKKQVYDSENEQFFTQDKDAIKSILDYNCYDNSYEIRGSKVYSSDIIIENDKYKYTVYSLTVVYGDWGLQDALEFIRTDIQIDIATGKTTYDYEVVGTAYIDGTWTNFEVIQ